MELTEEDRLELGISDEEQSVSPKRKIREVASRIVHGATRPSIAVVPEDLPSQEVTFADLKGKYSLKF
jgi:hypothetical protein